MKYFVGEESIVRKIWGKADIILFIFAGSAAEFALNKAVDWLYFTGKLPEDPLGRLFSTVIYARRIIFSTYDEANVAIDQITSIHRKVEAARGAQIPDWAYRDVLFMLIDYSVRSYELLERKLNDLEKQEVFDVFNKVGIRMGIKDLPADFKTWEVSRDAHLHQDLEAGHFTRDLFQQYKKHLGKGRYWLMVKVQAILSPLQVRQLLKLNNGKSLVPLLYIYKWSGVIGIKHFLRNALLPAEYSAQIKSLDQKS